MFLIPKEKDGIALMETGKDKLLKFVENLSDDDLKYLCSCYQEIVALFEASDQPFPLGNHELTA